MRILILSTTTGYQLRAFDDAAKKLGWELAFATDRCKSLDDPWQDHAIPVKFHDAEQETSLAKIARASGQSRFDGVVAVGDRPVVLASLAAEQLGVLGNPPAAARVSTSKLLTRDALDRAGLPVPWFVRVGVDAPVDDALARAHFPCVIKPVALAGSRGVVRADDEAAFREAFARVRALLERRDVRVHRNPDHRSVLLEGYIPGDEYAIEGIMRRGDFAPLALFDKPDPLVGPFFEETIYVTPSRLEAGQQQRIFHTVGAACRAIGLRHGSVHAEVRVNESGVFVLEVAARPIGGLCARALRFVDEEDADGAPITLEELLLRHAVGEPIDAWHREPCASGVMMIPVPRRGQLKAVEGLENARAVPGVEGVIITAKIGQMLVPWPEGASYPGFIFARGDTPQEVEKALRDAHARLEWRVERPLDVVEG
jgi:biotin carboxylase